MTGFSLRLWNGNLCKNPRAVEKSRQNTLRAGCRERDLSRNPEGGQAGNPPSRFL